ncbi:MAG TPA: hypothetical protein VFZ64_01650 [Nocardioidaceae bacterium]
MNRSREDEYAEAFRQGYERARRGFDQTARIDRRPVPDQRAAPTAPPPGTAPGTAPPRDARRRTTRAAGGLVAAAVLLVGAAFGAGRFVASQGVASGPGEAAEADQVRDSGPTPYDGPVGSVGVTGSSATCQSAASVDVAGNPVTYEPARAHDGDLSTAWRCPGAGRGERLTVTLPEGTVVAEVGLVPGYAKTDAVSGEDRYAQNNRITRVRWHFDDGSSHVQRMRGDAGDRSMRTLRVPETATGSVELEILASQAGPRDTVAVSEIRIASPTG